MRGRRDETIGHETWAVRILTASGAVRFAQRATDGRGTLTRDDIRRAYDNVVLQAGERAQLRVRYAGSARFVIDRERSASLP